MSGVQKLRKLWFQVHLWLGVGLFLASIPLGVTGSLLVWRDATDAFAHPARYAVSKGAATRPLADYVAGARHSLKPGETISAVRLPEGGKGPVVVTAMGKRAPGAKPGSRPPSHWVWVDPVTARAVADGAPLAGLTKFAHDFHGHLLIPGIGRKIVGWLGVALLISSLTGLWLWWPRSGPVLKGLRWRRSGMTTANLHHMTGFWVALPLALLSLTGIWICFPKTTAAIVQPFAGAPEERGGGGGRGGAPAETTVLSADAAAAVTLEAAPGSHLAQVGFPGKSRAIWTVQVRRGGEPVEFRIDDAVGGKVVRTPGPSGTDAVARTMRRLHAGETGGVIWQALVFVVGFAPLILGLTGVWMWFRQRQRRRSLTGT